MSGNLLLAHDLGTSGNKATLFDPDGNLLVSKTVPYDTFYSNVTWAEQDPLVWWEAVCASTRAILQEHKADEIGVVTFSGQMMGCLPVDAKGRPLKNHIIYSDQRAVRQTEKLVERIDAKRIFEITGHRASPWSLNSQPVCVEFFKAFVSAGSGTVFSRSARVRSQARWATFFRCVPIGSLIITSTRSLT